MKSSKVFSLMAFSLSTLLAVLVLAGCAAPKKAAQEADKAAIEKQRAEEEAAKAKAEAEAKAKEEEAKKAAEEAKAAEEKTLTPATEDQPPAEEASKIEVARINLQYKIWVGNFSSRKEAVKTRNELRNKGFADAFIKEKDGIFHVQIGSFRSQDAARYVANEVRTLGYKTNVVEVEEK